MTLKRSLAAFTLLAALALAMWFYRQISHDQAPGVSVARLIIGYFDARACVFPTDPETLDVTLRNLRRSPNDPCLRKHSWALFDSLSGKPANSGPPWINWCAIYTSGDGTTYLACPPGGLPADPLTGSILPVSPVSVRNLIATQFPRQLFFSLAPTYARTMQEVVLDPATSQTILTCFHSGEQHSDQKSGLKTFSLDLNRRRPECKSNTGDFANLFDQNSTAVKLVWSVVRNEYDFPPVWDSTLKGAESTIGTEVARWDPGVQLNLDDRPCPKIFAQSLTRDPVGMTGSYRNDPTVPLNCFYWTQVTNSDLNDALDFEQQFTSLFSELGLRTEPEANNQLKGTSNGGHTNYLVLLGFHVTTRKTTDWTWQTYWWSGRTSVSCAESGENCLYTDNPRGNSETIPGMRWSHYVMSTTLGQPRKDQPATATFNPYLEGQNSLGPNTNCLNCHQYAIFHPGTQADSLFETEQQRGSSGRNLPIHGCTTSEDGDRDGKDSDLFQNGTKTDCLWSLASSNVRKHGGKTLLEFLLEETFDLRIEPGRVP
jgi:hypothetical protein